MRARIPHSCNNARRCRPPISSLKAHRRASHLNVRMNDSTNRLTRRDLIASSSLGAAALGSYLLGSSAPAAAQPIGSMPSTTKELWQWFRTQPVLDLQRTYLDVATAGPTLRAAMATEYRVRDSQSLNLA